ncbi:MULTISPECIES: protocatechuate 3,4-dioxygenase subunit alpha [unclassified Thalassospira]|uniref:protocatechuate 3,4-dioxygenase subunit alpha n=1 Tax=unclassified Thalassospira TaxID=2648997 RepID=UPI0007A5E6B9|nr:MULTISPECIES: protocatechuate 3,4-dioxygenase subunit alpha [unclassified Thalassospira]KZC98637.1 protocatechuate 3,4-dioxygenase subunit alpha [Thalassospira sp. MCCC 1A02898]ONH86495.1 protocatechuate 3,4-dioxygenase subunit alpha [Thalassospira sp. MCCC 1A02803]
MVQSLDYLKETASQTAGPYVHIGLIPNQAGFDIFENNFTNVLADENTRGERIIIEGRVIDGTGTPLRDALLEIWQANADGRYNHELDRQNSGKIDEDFRGWGRTGTDFDTAVYRFETIKPGVVSGRNGKDMAPHVNFWIVARGINIGLNTRMYFADEQDANAADPVLNLIEQKTRRKTLIADRDDIGPIPVYRFDIVLQGDGETVFFDL